MKRNIVKWLGAATLLASVSVVWAQTATDKPAPKVSEYAWPTETSKEPTDEEWANATKLETIVKLRNNTLIYWRDIGCTPRAVREWVKLTCSGLPESKGEPMWGAIWVMAGDFANMKGSFALMSTLDAFKDPPKDDHDRMTRKMGASATTTFQMKPGTAFVLQLDELFWNENYGDISVEPRAGFMVDVSWALGEKAPVIMVR